MHDDFDSTFEREQTPGLFHFSFSQSNSLVNVTWAQFDRVDSSGGEMKPGPWRGLVVKRVHDRLELGSIAESK